MKITIKTLKQEAFHIEVDLEKDTVRTLKEKFFQESKQDYPVERQRLIYLGKIMEDDDPLSQYNLDDKKFVVVMNKKPATAPAEPAAATTSAAPAAAKSSTESTPAAAAAAEKPKEEDKPKEDKKPEPEPPQDDIQIKIQRITEMGYSEEEARIALEICDNNPDRAVEYLLSEIATSSMPSAVGGVGGASSGGGLLSAGSQESRLAFLREHPTFLEMKRLLQEDPSLLPQLLQKIQSSNPDLMRIISENQVEFLALINEGAEGTGGSDGGRSGGGVPRELETTAAAMVDSLTQSDMDAIDRLKALGYPEHLVIQAYIACERNEYQAAEFLVSQTLDDDE
ncbi:UV excision repair protein RAD23 homolog B-like [Culex quinquefasciatus]|uniref:UV excision repair protein RAD23 homolog B-like n=1 Tax=Culex quinquefasciatus TaxID=7176 RepID=UPI0018E29509|nr:UV excision repair protein RAD23 homolog B-like [Culex quinquefasciatus]XP_038104782.1 UV excision repair protein RAD23 homolog B-like [Culex quinquefasciatus]